MPSQYEHFYGSLLLEHTCGVVKPADAGCRQELSKTQEISTSSIFQSNEAKLISRGLPRACGLGPYALSNNADDVLLANCRASLRLKVRAIAVALGPKKTLPQTSWICVPKR
jgi:hypothetical protein